MGKIISLDRSVVPACDVDSLEKLAELVEATSGVKGIGAYKVGFELVIKFGLREVVSTVKGLSDLPVIYDHQKAGNDIPEMGERFAASCKESGVDAVILFPFTGPKTEKAWIEACKNKGLGVIVGGEMTHEGFLQKDGGSIAEGAPEKIYSLAAENGVTDFVVPGNKPEKISYYRELLEKKGVKPVLYSPGLIAQGGKITDSAKAAGSHWHAIIGRGIYGAQDMKAAAEEFAKALL
ncbi:MAG: orotidine 5'-phosphate decarboxylase / HUMPS family protein [Candidatus Diapherotrites archaeon]